MSALAREKRVKELDRKPAVLGDLADRWRSSTVTQSREINPPVERDEWVSRRHVERARRQG
jgi:hypothetical protein